MDERRRADILPLSLPPRGLSRVEAAAYVGVSPTTFDKMVNDGRMPGAKKIGARRNVWDRQQIDMAFAALPDDNNQDGDDLDNDWDAA